MEGKQDKRIGEVLLGRFKVEKHLSSGGFAQVYVAADLENEGTKVAVKFDRSVNAHLLERTILEKLEPYKGKLIALLGHGTHGPDPFLVLELLGMSLDDVMHEHKRIFTLKTVCQIGI